MKRQVQKTVDKSVYTRLAGKDSDDEETELQTVQKTIHKEIPTIDKELEDGDTLQSISIRYQCTIAELKRLNNIIRENEIFAKRIIKVPHRPFSILLAGVHTSGNSSPSNNSALIKNPVDASLLTNSLLTLPSGGDHREANGIDAVNTVIFNSSVTSRSGDSGNVARSRDDLDNTLEDIRPSEPLLVAPPPLVTADTFSVIKANSASRWFWNGADADISWIALISCIVILILAVPLIYVLYIAEHPDQYHHTHHHIVQHTANNVH